MGYDPKERALGWGDVGAAYLVTVAAIAGMALLLSAEAPERSWPDDRVLQRDAASVATEGDRLTRSRSAALPREADGGATDTIWGELPRSCPRQPNPKSRALRHAAG